MKKYIKPCLSVMLGLLSFLALNENLNAIWLNASGHGSHPWGASGGARLPPAHGTILLLISFLVSAGME